MESQYYAQTPQQVLHAVESQEEGLTTQQAQERIEKNLVPKRPAGGEKKAGVAGVLEQFKDLLVVNPRCGCGDLYALGQRGEHHRHLCRAHP